MAHRFEERVGWQECGETAGVVVQVQKVRNVAVSYTHLTLPTILRV